MEQGISIRQGAYPPKIVMSEWSLVLFVRQSHNRSLLPRSPCIHPSAHCGSEKNGACGLRGCGKQRHGFCVRLFVAAPLNRVERYEQQKSCIPCGV